MKFKGQILIILALFILIFTFTIIPLVSNNLMAIDDTNINTTLEYKVASILLDYLAYTTDAYRNYNESVLNNVIATLLDSDSNLFYRYYRVTLSSSNILITTNIPNVVALYSSSSLYIKLSYSDNKIPINIYMLINSSVTPSIISQVYTILLVNVTYVYVVNSLRLLVPLTKAYIDVNGTIVYGYIERNDDSSYTIYFPLPIPLNQLSEVTLYMGDKRGVFLWCVISLV